MLIAHRTAAVRSDAPHKRTMNLTGGRKQEPPCGATYA
jgi:hypothetical protein